MINQNQNKMKQDLVVKKKITIKADPSKVWDALTKPEFTKKYFFDCEVFSDWKEGSPIVFKDAKKGKEMVKGKIVKIEPRSLLQYTVLNSESGRAENPSNFSLVTDKLSYHDGETTLSITDDIGKAEGAEERYKKSDKGWDSVLKGLKELLENPN
jgi:uncharacterized protein YndB with AHSA1/START domain